MDEADLVVGEADPEDEPTSRTKVQHRRQRSKGRHRRLRLAGATVVVAAGAGLAAGLILGRPSVSITESDQALVRLHVQGFEAKLSSISASSGGDAITLTHQGAGFVPRDPVGQGQAVSVKARVSPPRWLRWLVGSGASASKALTTPSANPPAPVALASKDGTVPVVFDRAVSVVWYRVAGGKSQTLHLAHPAEVADLAVPPHYEAGSIDVAAAPQTWERVADPTTTVTWFAAGSGDEPEALADPVPESMTAASNGRILLTFSKPVQQLFGSTRPTVTPAVPGSWSQPGPDTLAFTPSGFGFGPDTKVTVSFDRPVSVVGGSTSSTSTSEMAASTSYNFTTAPASILRLEQILAQLQYLPLSFTPAPGASTPTTLDAEVASMIQPVDGTFAWRWPSAPSALQGQWQQGSSNVLVKGALMSFLSVHGTYSGYQIDPETVAQIADASTWQTLLQAAMANQVDPNPYSYVYVTKAQPETLTLWQDGAVKDTVAVNTGIPQAPTDDGTFPIYLRYQVNHMIGTNPDGTPYDDIVYWINYFNGGDAVHGFDRGSYGFPQSLGCVELPVSSAQTVFNLLAIGDLVTVAG
ncbi:MAG: L,D-transpeptidase family protein [Acidimicrobiales bacterium]